MSNFDVDQQGDNRYHNNAGKNHTAVIWTALFHQITMPPRQKTRQW